MPGFYHSFNINGIKKLRWNPGVLYGRKVLPKIAFHDAPLAVTDKHDDLIPFF